MNQLRLAVVGVGWAGQRQIQAARAWGGDLDVTCLVDADSEFLTAKAIELGIARTYTDYQQALADLDIDAVSICTPHPLHAPMAIAAAEAGKHILVEKPMAMTVEDATHMLAAAGAAGVKLYVAENLPYHPMATFLRGIVTSGEYIGELIAASLVFSFRDADFGYPGRRAWLTQPGQGGTGTWMLHGIHNMAQLRYIFGEVDTVYLREHHAASFARPDIEGTLSGVLTLNSGVHVTLMQSCEVQTDGNWRGYTLYGDKGCIRAWREGYEVLGENGASERFTYPEASLDEYALEMKAFTDYVLRGVDGPTSGWSERRSLAIVQAGYEAMSSHAPVSLTARFGAL